MDRTSGVHRSERWLSRRALLSCGAKGLAACQFAPVGWVARVSNANLSVSDGERSEDLVFDRSVVDLPFGNQLRECFVVDGKLSAKRSRTLYGAVLVGFADQTAASVQIVNNEFTSSYGGSTIVVRPDSDQVRVNGSPRRLTSLVEQLIRENNFTGIGALSCQSRALVALGALANTDHFISSLRAAYGPHGGMLARMCRLTPAPSGEIAWWKRRLPLLKKTVPGTVEHSSAA